MFLHPVHGDFGQPVGEELMIHYQQHIPGFVSGAEKEEGSAPDLASLLGLEFIRQRQGLGGFKRWSMSDNSLMAEYNDGKFWVVAHLNPDSPDELSSLPKWELPK